MFLSSAKSVHSRTDTLTTDPCMESACCRYVGEGEAQLRQAFQRARLAAPALLVLDEVDTLFANRAGAAPDDDTTAAQLLSALLTEMDGLTVATGAALVMLLLAAALCTCLRESCASGLQGACLGDHEQVGL